MSTEPTNDAPAESTGEMRPCIKHDWGYSKAKDGEPCPYCKAGERFDRDTLEGDTTLLNRILWRLFGSSINAAVHRITFRAYENGIIGSRQMHEIDAISHRATMPKIY